MQVLIEQKRQYIFINKIWKNGHDAQKEQFNFYKRFPKLNKHFKPHGIATNYVKPIAANMSSKTGASPTFITLVGVLSVAVQLVVCGAGRVGDLRLVAGGYEGLAITISDSLPQQQCNQIIHGLKAMLSEFSKALHDSTDGRASLRDVTVILPRSWSLKSPTCTLWEPVIISALPTPSHIRVASSHPVFGDNPWVQQSQGCGRQGDFIQMGGNLLRATTNSSYSAAGRLLLAQWVKFRWGVFDEHGYEGDPLYPASYLDHVTGKLRPNTCKIPAKQLPYCAIEDHVPEAPTKQNVQCEGRAAWDIILHSNDFNNQRDMMHNGTDKLAPDIHFMQPGPPRIVIVVEDTAVMNLQRRWEFVRKALRRTVVYDVPDGAHVAVVVFNSVARTATALSKVDGDSDVRQRIGSSLPRNPSQVPESHKCLLCGFQEALRALDSDVNGAEGATVVLLTTGAMEVSIQELDEINHLAKQRNIQVEAVIYPFTEKSGSVTNKHGLEDIVKNTHGSAYTVMDEGVGNDSKLHMMVALMNSLREVIRHSSSSGTPTLVHSHYYPGGIDSLAKGTFTLDESLGPDMYFFIYYYDLTHVGNTIELTMLSGKTITSAYMQEDGDANVIFINIPSAERGEWRYKIENRADSHQGLVMQVTTSENKERKIKMRVWTSNANNLVRVNNSTSPLIIYAELKDDDVPILNARVVAKLKRLGTNESGSTYDSIYIHLFDNGFGDPDVTGGDGVYSRYLPYVRHQRILPGHYELTVSANNNDGLAVKPVNNVLTRGSYNYLESNEKGACCGSNIKYDHMTPLSVFQQSVTYGVIGIISQVSEDTFPPNRILDLHALVNKTTQEVSLRWTAPGDDYDWGIAENYEAILASSWSEAMVFSGQKISGMPSPSSAGIEQSVNILLEIYDRVIYVALRASDDAGNHGAVSNIVTIIVPHPPTTTTAKTTTFMDIETQNYLNEPLGSRVTKPLKVAGFDFEEFAVIIVGFILIITILTIFCFINAARRKRNQRKKDTDNSDGDKHMSKANSSIIVNQDESQDSVDSAIKDLENLSNPGRPLSPLPSWSASKLLQEHEQRFSTSGGPSEPVLDQLPQYHCVQESFPDVTLTGTQMYPIQGTQSLHQSYPNSETTSVTHSDPPAYQANYNVYPYPAYPSAHPEEELNPYFIQSLQPSTIYTQAVAPQPSHMTFSNSIQTYPGEIVDLTQLPRPPPLYIETNSEIHNPQSSTSKVPPPVAPKPLMNTQTAIVTTVLDPKRRNVTQV